MKRKIDSTKVKAFFKKNMYYIIMGVCVLAIGAIITVAVVATQDKSDPIQGDIGNDNQTPSISDDNPVVKPDEPDNNEPDNSTTPVVKPNPIVFALPIADGTILKDYTMDTLVWSSTLKQYQVHNGIDFTGAEGAVVTAVYAGTVTDVSYDALNGNSVTIDHGNGLKTVYSSLSEAKVAVGQNVYAGTELGAISSTATGEMSDGAHVHFSVYLNGAVANPYDYLPEGDK